MKYDIPLKCTCGLMRGTAEGVSPGGGNHIVCLCDDCQAYIRYLGREDEILDRNGGTEIFQFTPAQLKITDGVKHLRCVRLSEKGLMRWYAGCCRTPVANTAPSAKLAFLGMPVVFAAGSDPGLRERAFGPLLSRVQGRFGYGEPAPKTHPSAPPWLLARGLALFLLSTLRRRHSPSPFFHAETGLPVVTPDVLPPTQKKALHRRADGSLP